MDEQHDGRVDPRWGVQWCLVEVLHDDVVVALRKNAAIVAAHAQTVALTSTDAMHLDAVDHLARGSAAPARRDERHAMAGAREPAEHLVEVHFGAAGTWITTVEPIEYEDVNRHHERTRGREATGQTSWLAPR